MTPKLVLAMAVVAWSMFIVTGLIIGHYYATVIVGKSYELPPQFIDILQWAITSGLVGLSLPGADKMRRLIKQFKNGKD